MARSPSRRVTTAGVLALLSTACLAWADESAPAAPAAPVRAPKPAAQTPAEVKAFLDRVFKRLPTSVPASFSFQSWAQEGKPTQEGFGLRPEAGLNPEQVIARIMDVDHYVGNLAHVLENRSVKDPRFVPPGAVRFYQRLDLSLLGHVHHELVLVDGGSERGYRVAYWYLLEDETTALGTGKGARSDYNVGAWLVSSSAIGYALSSAPVKDDVSWPKWVALTDGADVMAKTVVDDNIAGMVAWVKKG